MPRHVAVDVETAQSYDHIIEIALVEIVDGRVTGREFVSRFRPTSAMNPFCQKVHGIGLRELAGEPFIAEKMADILEFVGDSVMVAHNKAVEEKTLAREMARLGLPVWGPERFLCTMAMAKDARCPKKGLRDACATLGIPTDHLGKHHTALQDTRLCAEIFARLGGRHFPAPASEAATREWVEVAEDDAMAEDSVDAGDVVDGAPPVVAILTDHVGDVTDEGQIDLEDWLSGQSADVPVAAIPAVPVPDPVRVAPEAEAATAAEVPEASHTEEPHAPTVTGKAGSGIALRVVSLPCYGLASQRGNVPLVHSLAVENAGEGDLDGFVVTVATEPPVTHPLTVDCDRVAARSTLEVPCRLVPAPLRLERVEESIPAVLTCTVERGGEILARVAQPFRVLARDEWPGAASSPELLAAFVRPNEASVDGLIRAASVRLGSAGRDPSLDGYAKGTRARAWEVAEAVYLALSDLGLSYALPPASFERRGQKVRSPSSIVSDRIATCLDTTLLYASCIEQAGLRPVLVLVRGHALCGVWLARESFGQCLVDEAAAVRRHVASGDLVVVETTMLTARVGFGAAAQSGMDRIASDEAFEMAIDVATARIEGVIPLELGLGGHVATAGHAVPEPVPFGETPDLDHVAPEDVQDGDRLSAWKRKLLDLSQRNRLLNYRDGKGAVPLLVADVSELEDFISGGEEVLLRHRAPTTIPQDRPDLLREALRAAFQQHAVVHSTLEEGDFERRLAEVERSGRTSLAEGGSNTLYVALGFLDWIQAGTRNGKVSRAPLLLVPVAISGTGARGRPRLRVISEETRFNPALVEMLRQNFRINLGGLAANLPRDGSGLHVASVFAQVSAAIRQMPGWSVDEHAVVLTTFSFTKFLMWKDLEERTEQVRESLTARLLLDGREPGDGTSRAEEREHAPDSIPPGDLHLPLPADASQVSAVIAAHAGESFVMIGPPGTGKSQTIANIIANSLAHGRTVLFVSQKTAALQAVSRRLEDVGLGAHCLEVHSNRAGRNEVLGQLVETWRTAVGGSTEGHQAAAAEVHEVRDGLNAFVDALHVRRPNGMTAHAAIARSVKARLAGRPLELDFAAMGDDHGRWLAEARDRCRDVEAMLGSLSPAEHPLADVTVTEWTPALAAAMAKAASAANEAASDLARALDAVHATVGAGIDETRDSIAAAGALRTLLARPEAAVGRRVLTAGAALRGAIHVASKLTREMDAQRAKLSCRYGKGILDLDLAMLSTRWEEAGRKGFIARGLARKAVRKAVSPFAEGRIPDDLSSDLVHLRQMRHLADEVARAVADGAIPKAFLRDGVLNLKAEASARAWASGVAAALRLMAPSGPRALAAALGDARLPGLLSDVADAHAAYVAAEADLLARSGAAPLSGEGWLAVSVARHEGWLAAWGKLQAWCCWREAEADARALGLGALVDAVAAGSLPANGVLAAFENAYAIWFAERMVGTEPRLRGFVRARHEALIERFREADERMMTESRVAVSAILGGNVPSPSRAAGMPEWLALQGQASSRQRNAMPLRQVFETVPGPLRTLAPCMMMSPLSVAQYMPVTSRFDLVIFDEASQVTPWDALGALARGRQAIVVGDPRQLPPTDSMFDGDGDGADGLDGTSPESVLDACVHAGMRSRHLRWHYRSRHESLIAFSKAYYYPEMLTFPSPTTRDDAVRVAFVADGSYDKGARVNQAEARALVADVVRRLTDPAFVARGASLGIVTFNGTQMVLIEELLLAERRARPEIDPFFDTGRPEHVFVKNLENVQGDERDVILFSVTFSRAPGKGAVSVVSNLNRAGGERRLNVAVTRAREEMVLFSSMRSADIGVSNSVGLAHFKAFLDFAERGPQALAQAVRPESRVDSVLELEIMQGLRARGWEVHPQVGVAGYRIDLGIVNPHDRGRYLAGVECDGATYHRAASARDRDKLRQSVLERLGWRIRRVWSTDWWHDPHGCMEELHEALRGDLAAFGGAPAGEPTVHVRTDAGMGTYAGLDGTPGDAAGVAGAREGIPVDQARFFEDSYRPILRRHAAAVVAAEWPVFQEEVVARVVATHGFRRVSRQMEETVLPCIERRFVRTRDGERVLRWLGKEHVVAVSPFRDSDRTVGYADVPMPRLAGLATRFLATHDEAAVIRAMADELGIDRVSGNARDRLQSAVDVARRHVADQGKVAEVG